MRHASGAKMYVMPSSAESAGHCSECNVALPLWHEAFLSFADTVKSKSLCDFTGRPRKCFNEAASRLLAQ